MKIKLKILKIFISLVFLTSCTSFSVSQKKLVSSKDHIAHLNLFKKSVENKDTVDFSNLKKQKSLKKNTKKQNKRSVAEDKTGEISKSQLTTSNSLVNLLPTKSLKNAVREYLQMIGLESYEYDDFGGENSGLVAYNQNLLTKNTCFSKLVSYYYFDIAKKNLEFTKLYPPSPTMLFESLAVNTEKLNIPSGWIWNSAYGLAKDANLAMSLIGICGHDNTAQLGEGEEVCETVKETYGTSTSCTSEDNTLPFFSQEHKIQYPKILKEQFNLLMEKWQPQDPTQKNYKTEAINSGFEDEEAEDGLVCPFLGPFYLQGSLGEKTILDSSLIEQISAIQAPTKGTSFLPSKYYHTMGGALTSCALARNNVPQFLIRKIQSVAVNTYRMNRLCEMYNEYDGNTLDMTKDEIISFVREFRNNPALCITGQDEEYGENEYDWNKPICNFLQDFDATIIGPNYNSSDQPALDYADLGKKIERKLNLPIAKKIFKNAITKEQCFSPQLTDKHIDKIKEISESAQFCDRDINVEQCKLARDIIKTWWVDFKWSESQQMKGVDFAIENCRPESNFISSKLEEKSCEALKTLEN